MTTSDLLLEQVAPRIHDELGASQVPGAAVGWLVGDQASVHGFGARRLFEPPVEPSTAFRVGSITKLFVATLVMRLSEAGAMPLDHPVFALHPDVPLRDETTRATLTVRHLLAHLGGFEGELPMRRGVDHVPYDLARFGDGPGALEQAIAEFGLLRTIAPPGRVFGYCNAGYWLLGHLCAQVAGSSFERLLTDEVLQPLGLRLSMRLGSEAAAGHRRDGAGGLAPVDDNFPRFRRASGGLVATAVDLLTFGHAHLGATGRLLRTSSRRAMQLPTAQVDDVRQMGLGWFLRTADGSDLLEHTGGTSGFQARLVAVPQQRTVIAVLTNAEHGGGTARRIADLVLESACGARLASPRLPTKRRAQSVPMARLRTLTGTYAHPYGDLELSLDGHGLNVIQDDLQGGTRRFRVRPVRADPMTLTDGEVELTFPLRRRDGRWVVRMDDTLGLQNTADGRDGQAQESEDMTTTDMPALLVNPRRRPDHVSHRGVGRDVLTFHASIPDYAATPLLDLPDVAADVGIGRLLLKDERQRYGLPAFKIVGASWAALRAIRERLGDPSITTFAHARDELSDRGLRLTLVTPTDGNFGRAIARIAGWVGARAEVFVPQVTAASRVAAIRGEGAEVEIVPGDYDVAASMAAARAADPDVVLVSDYAATAGSRSPDWVAEGYGTIFWELEDQLAALDAAPDVVLVPVGAGSLACGVIDHFRRPGAVHRPTLVGIEPVTAACVLASVRAGEITEVPGPHPSMMQGLNCGRPSVNAWPSLRDALDLLVTVPDAAAAQGMRRLADAGLDVGECGATALAALITHGSGLLAAAGVGSGACVLSLITEGPTDPDSFERVVGRPPRSTVRHVA